jgi:hypothetical protein
MLNRNASIPAASIVERIVHRYKCRRTADAVPSIGQPMKTRLLAIACLASLMVMAIWHGHAAMGQTVDAKNREEFLDRSFPFIDQGQEPPGRFAPSEKLGGRLAWQGQMGWRTRHGPAIVIWSLGKPNGVENALYPDGSRGEAHDTLDHGFRRRATGDRLWIYGRIDVRSDDVVFIDGDQPVYQPPPQGQVPNLEADLARDPAFLAAIKDDRFALGVLSVFDNRGFYKGLDARLWECGASQAAGLVADLRGLGESYQDYYPGNPGLAGTYPDDRPDVERRLQARIDQISKSLATGPQLGVRVEDLGAWLGPGEHSAEEVRRAMAAMQPELEKRRAAEIGPYRERLRAALEQAQRNLAAFRENHTNDDMFEALRAHLSRLGWRTETEEDRERVHQEWVGRAVQVLQELEQRSAAPPEAWAEPLRNRAPTFVRAFGVGQLESMSTDVRAVETGELDRRLRDLALTGRITEQEYRALTKRSARIATIANDAEAATHP